MRTAASRTKGKFYLLSFVLFCTGVSFAMDNKSVAMRKYEILRTRVIGNDLTVDWGEFRVAAAVAEVDKGFDWHPVRERVLSEVEAGDLVHAMAGAQTVISRNMAEPEGHLLAMMIYQKMGKDQEAQREHNIVDSIVKSIMSSGDGQSEQKAFVTVSEGEKDFVVSIVLDAEAKSQVVVHEAGHDYDKVIVAGDDGVERTVWFNTDTDVHVAMNEMHIDRRDAPMFPETPRR
jgi:hypothetical protein